MFQPLHIDSFLRLFVTHLGTLLEQGERVLELRDPEKHQQALLEAIEYGENQTDLQVELGLQRDYQALMVLQLSQAREWADRLGQFAPEVERQTDEFLCATFMIEKLLRDRASRDVDYRLENRLDSVGNDNVLRYNLVNHADIEKLMIAIYELLGRLEEEYDLAEELGEIRMTVNGAPFAAPAPGSKGATVLPLFGKGNKALHADNDRDALR